MIGYHYVWDVYDCNANKISFKEQVSLLLHEIVLAIGINKVGESYKQFEPIGATGIILLEESHLSIHTWPEHGFIAVDLFSCKKIASLADREVPSHCRLSISFMQLLSSSIK